ncbi:MAG: hypothetical protein WDN26_18135 [Chitinophagaceae bacterium]
MKLFFLFCSILLSAVCSAQQNAGTYTIKAGENIFDVIPSKEIFQYPDFIQGTVVFKNGTATGGKLNYNSLIAAIQFIDAKGDTLSLANEETVNYIQVSRDTFYYNEGYLRLLAGNASIKLAERVFFQEFVQKPGSYGLSTATTATNTISSIIDKRAIDLNTSQEVVLVKSKVFLIAGKFNDFVIADKKNILKMFKRQQDKIKEYFDKNAIEFNKEDDLIKVTNFLKGL